MDLLAYIGLPLTIVLGVEILKYKAYKIVPWFSIYVLFDIAEGFARFFVRNHHHLYFWVYWSTDIALMLLEFAVLCEVYRYIFRSFSKFWWVPVVILIAAVLVSLRTHNAPFTGLGHLGVEILVAEMGLQLMAGITFIILVISLPFFHLRWKRYPLGIITGFGFYAVISLTAISKISVFVTKFEIFGWIYISAYIIALLIWIWFFRKPQEPDPRPPDISIYDALAEMQKYRRILKRFRER